MTEILELNTKISDDDIMGMFAHQSKNIPENDVYAAFEKGVKFAESFYKVELNKRTGLTEKFAQWLQDGRVKDMDVSVDKGKITFRDTRS